MRRCAVAGCCLLLLFASMWWARGGSSDEQVVEKWREVAPGVWRSVGQPCGYALLDGDAALLIGASRSMNWQVFRQRHRVRIEGCLLTHHHRDTSALAAELLRNDIKVRAPKASEEWLSTDGVQRFWKTCLPELVPGKEPGLKDRTFNAFAYLVQPQGLDQIDCSLEDGQTMDWHDWRLTVIATPGHSRDHVAYAVSRRASAPGLSEKIAKVRGLTPAGSPEFVFCGDAFSQRGKLWSPYTTDWDHWSDAGLKAAAESLRKLAALEPTMLCPEHGPVLKEDVIAALDETAKVVDEVGFLKSFERFSKQRLGNAPTVEFLAKDQVATAGEKPWSKLSPHLFLTGNTFVLRSDADSIMVVDPFGANLAEQIRRLQRDEKLGAIEVVLVSHAHNDHYVGLHQLPNRDKFEVWTIDEVARPIEQPFGQTAFALDARSVRTDRWLKSGERVAWREFAFDIRHFPGQTYFTMGALTTIDGRKCFFTADNFFHADQFSGSGGWSGRNRGWPDMYAKSAQAVLDAVPEWVLAEHGGAFAFNAEDFQRRVAWGQAAAKAADAVSRSGHFRRDWNPSRIQPSPMLVRVLRGGMVRTTLVIDNPLPHPESLHLVLEGIAFTSTWSSDVVVPAQGSARTELSFAVSENLAPGRYVVPIIASSDDIEDGGDCFLVVDVTSQ